MSRLARFTWSLTSGYLLLGSNIVFTLASVPLALHYLSKDQFGLWAAILQMSGYLQLVDFGMSGSMSRILIDHKDDSTTTIYGEVIQTAFRVLAIQGLLIAALGALVAYPLPGLMRIDTAYWSDFRQLMAGQCFVLALGFGGRIFQFILQAHHRFDISNYLGIANFAVQFAVLWITLASGLGVYGMLVSNAVGTVFLVAGYGVAAQRLNLFPAPNRWGTPSWTVFRQLFSYGSDIFLLSIGQMLVTTSQLPVISRMLGLEAATTWSVATKVFMLAQQVVNRILDYSSTPLAEMMVQGERSRLYARFRDVVILTAASSVFFAAFAVLCNPSILLVWVRGVVSWEAENDIAMGVSLLVYSITRCHIGLAGLTKDIRNMKFLYFVEGVAFVAMALFAAPRFGLFGVIVSGILTNLLFSGAYGLMRTADYFRIPATEPLLGWLKHAAIAFVPALALVILLRFATADLAPFWRLAVSATSFSLLGGWCVWRFALPTGMRAEIFDLGRGMLKRYYGRRNVWLCPS